MLERSLLLTVLALTMAGCGTRSPEAVSPQQASVADAAANPEVSDELARTRKKLNEWKDSHTRIAGLLSDAEKRQQSLLEQLDAVDATATDSATVSKRKILNKELKEVISQVDDFKKKLEQYSVAILQGEGTLATIERREAAKKAGADEKELADISRTIMTVEENFNQETKAAESILDSDVSSAMDKFREKKAKELQELKNRPIDAAILLTVSPEDAKIIVSGGDTRVEGEKENRRVIIKNPDPKATITVVAMMDGYLPKSKEFHLSPASQDTFYIKLDSVTAATTSTVSATPVAAIPPVASATPVASANPSAMPTQSSPRPRAPTDEPETVVSSSIPSNMPKLTTNPEFVSLFDGKTFNGWVVNKKYWSIVGGAIVGQSRGEPDARDYISTKRKYKNFMLKLKYKLQEGDSGILFRSEPNSMYGLQAPLGKWEKFSLMDETGAKRGQKAYKVVGPNGQTFNEINMNIKRDDWNDVLIVVDKSRFYLDINARTSFDTEYDNAPSDGVISLKVRPNTFVAFKDIQIATLP